jgi:hypothetical protein
MTIMSYDLIEVVCAKIAVSVSKELFSRDSCVRSIDGKCRGSIDFPACSNLGNIDRALFELQ